MMDLLSVGIEASLARPSLDFALSDLALTAELPPLGVAVDVFAVRADLLLVASALALLSPAFVCESDEPDFGEEFEFDLTFATGSGEGVPVTFMLSSGVLLGAGELVSPPPLSEGVELDSGGVDEFDCDPPLRSTLTSPLSPPIETPIPCMRTDEPCEVATGMLRSVSAAMASVKRLSLRAPVEKSIFQSPWCEVAGEDREPPTGDTQYT
jgi:hypothetical protein